jgi:hypothetical protein
MSAIIACTAGREAFDATPTRSATPAIATGCRTKPSSATDPAVADCAAISVARRPIRSASTPPPSEPATPPSPCRAAISPAYEAE